MTPTDLAAPRPGLIARHPLVSFFLLAYALSWLVLTPALLARNGLGVLDVELPRGLVALLFVLATFGPLVAALIVRRVAGSPDRSILRRMVQLKANPAAWAIALVLVPAAIATFMWLLARHGEPGGKHLVVAAIIQGVLGFLSGPLGEEPGWRGFATPTLQRRMHPLAAAGVLGVLWAGWHLPQFFIREWDTPRANVGDVILFVLFCVFATVVLNALVNISGSILLVIAAHTAINATPGIVHAVTGRGYETLPVAGGLCLVAAVLAVLTRGRLGAPADETRVGSAEPITRGAARLA